MSRGRVVGKVSCWGRWFAGIWLALSVAAPVAAQPASADLAAIRAESQAFVSAFNKRDAKAIAGLWTSDGEYVDDSDRKAVGRDAIEKAYRDFFAARPKAEIRIVIDSVKMLSETTALEDGRSYLEPAPAGPPGISHYTAVHVKQDGKWRMASVRERWVETPSAHANLIDLEWLVGTWTAEERGVKTESTFAWAAGKNFLERRYSITLVDGSKTNGLQLIGWNPAIGRIQSWNFGPDGGHAVGVWTPHDGGWSAQLQGVAADGAVTSAVNLLTRLDPDAYVWRSIRRSIGDVALPDSDEVVWKRRSSTP